MPVLWPADYGKGRTRLSDAIQIGIVGARRGPSLVAGFRAIEGVDVTAICDIDRDFLAEQADENQITNRFANYEEMLGSDIDLVVVATPMHLHVPHSLAALAAGKHVMSEVTAAVSVEQCKELLEGVEAARESGLKYMMAENMTYLRHNVLIKNMVEQGAFGEIYYAEGQYIHEIKSLHYNDDGSPTWRSRWQVGVNGCTYGTHSLGPPLEWFDERVDTVICVGTGRHTAPQHVAEDSTTMLCKTTSGALIDIRVDMLSNRPHTPAYYSLQGTKGCFEGARGLGDKPKVWLDRWGAGSASRDSIDVDPYEWRPLEDLEDEFLPEMWRNPPAAALASGHWGSDYFIARDIVEAIREDKEPRLDVYRALDFTLPGLMSEKSIAQGGAPVKVPDFRSGEWD